MKYCYIFFFAILLFFTCPALSQQTSITDDFVPGSEFLPGPVSASDLLDAGQWSLPNTFPDLPAATYFQASAWLGDTLYVQTPTSTGTPSTAFLKYTIGGTWTTASMPVSIIGGALTRCGNKLYYSGGSLAAINGTAVNTMYEYNPATGSWTTMATMPVALAGHGAVNWGDSVIFVVGGPYTGSGTNLNVHFYRTVSNTWGTITGSLPTGQGRRTFGLGITGNKIIMAGGFNTAFLKNTFIGVLGANATTLTWHAGPDIPTTYTGLSRPGAVGIANYFYLVNGEKGGPGGYYDTTHIMNTTTEQWFDVVNNKPVKMSNICNAVAARTFGDTIKVFVPGGYGSTTGLTPGVAFATFDAISRGNLLLVPVELTSFTVSAAGADVILNWVTATEVNNKGFEIRRSLNNGSYVSAGFIEGNGTTTQQSVYSFKDKDLPNGIYKYILTQEDFDGTRSYSKEVEVEVNNIPQSFSLDQNYPNPFNPTTNIRYQLPDRSEVTLTLYNSLGESSILFTGLKDAGVHSVHFNASGLPSGVYYYKLQAGNFTEVKKMIYIK